MILLWFILVLLLAGGLAAAAAHWNPRLSRWIALAAVACDFFWCLWFWIDNSARATVSSPGRWLTEMDASWIPQFGVHFHLAADGLSLILLMLTFFLGVLSVLASWTEIHERPGFYYFNLLWILSGIAGVFVAADLLLFYMFWELMLIPMYFLIAVWGHERRIYAAIKFFLFTQFSGLLMLVAIVALYLAHSRATGVATFDYGALLGTALPANAARWMFLGFFVAFAVKLPMLPLHTWLPDAHTEAPTAGSVILAGLLLKTGAYGLIRFAIPLFPGAAHEYAPLAMILGAIGVLYGGVLALGQSDLKRMVAYTSVSHMGFVLMGIFAGTTLALQGAVAQMVCHGISTGGLFIIVGLLYERTHTRSLRDLSGLWATAPTLSGLAMFFAMASLGLPGLGDFVGEFLVLLGSYAVNPVVTTVAVAGIIVATLYGLRLAQKAFQGPNTESWSFPDLGFRERFIGGVMAAALLWIGLYPQPLLHAIRLSFEMPTRVAATFAR